MQTYFSAAQLTDPAIRRSNEILRDCVHCGMCTATCPTYTLLGDELDSPRGRIYLIKDMLENERIPTKDTVKHIDRCLSCLACMTTCPSGVHYMHLIDHARAYIEARYKRPLFERLLRWSLARILPYPKRFRAALHLAKWVKPLQALLPDPRLKAMLDMAPAQIPAPSAMDKPQTFPARAPKVMRVALMTGCAQRTLNPAINEATIRLLTRLGAEVVIAKDQGCCGALTHHMGQSEAAHSAALRNIRAFLACGEIDAIVINTSGCGTTVKDYGHMFREDPLHAADAAKVASLALDVSEVIAKIGLPEGLPRQNLRVGYHSACSLQHGQKIKTLPQELLRTAGFDVLLPADSHLCCGSAGTYNLMQPALSSQLQERKVQSLERLKPAVIAAGNIGCMMQIGAASQIGVVHTVELLDWATGGPKPAGFTPARNAGVPILR